MFRYSNLESLWARWSLFKRRFRAFLGKGWIIERTPILVSFEQQETAPAPIFIIGTNRSGTSLVRRILDSHSEIACPPETFFLAHYVNLINDPEAMIGFNSMGISEDDVLSVIRKQASFFHNSYRTAKGKRRWADKTPQYTYALDGIERLFGPGTLYIWIKRNPLDVAHSLWNRGWKIKEFGKDELTDVCLFVRDSYSRQRAFFDALDKTRYIVVEYEELAQEPERVLRSITAFLGEKFEPQMLRFWEVHHDFGTEDPVVRGTKGFQISKGAWKGWEETAQRQALHLLADVIRESGYEGAQQLTPAHS